ncbi:MAG: FliM/FliN family flagellar motor switch protein [Myxococcales bacterium]|nr:FliM/FliN family flagellar motor switch protein [Myxococcales bacterium]
MSEESTEPLLSPEETHALLDAMRSGDEAEGQVESADLASAERPLRAALGFADRCARMYGEEACRVLLRMVNCPTRAEEQPAEIVPYKVLRGAVERGAVLGVLSTRDGSRGVIVVGPMLVSFLLDRRMGAPVAPDAEGEESPRLDLSALDQRLIEPAVRSLFDAFAAHWCEGEPSLSLELVTADTTLFPSMAQFEPMLQMNIRVIPAGGVGDHITVALSAGAVRASFKDPEPQARVEATVRERGRMQEAVREVAFRAVAILGERECTLRDILALEKGNLLRLDGVPGVPIDMKVEDRVVLRGTPVLEHGNIAIEVTEVC